MAASVHAHFYVVSTESLVLVYLSLPNLVFITGNPGVTERDPYPTRTKPQPVIQVGVSVGRGRGSGGFFLMLRVRRYQY